MTIREYAKRFDWVLLGLALAIAGFGIVTFYAIDPSDLSFVYRQSVFIILGLIAIGFIGVFDYRILKNYSAASIAIYIFSLLLLLLVLATKEIRGASSWLTFFGLRVEPSEFAKLALVVLLAKYFSQKHVEIYRFHHIIASALYAFIPAGLTLLQPDLGSMLIFVAVWFAMLLFSGIKRTHFLALLMIGVIVVTSSWAFVLKPYQKDRIISFANPYLDPQGRGYNTIQARTTLGSGQWFGTYFTEKREMIPVLVPEPYTDFTFAAFGQKFGYIGILALLALVAGLMIRIGSIASKTKNNFAKLYSLGFLTIIGVHVVINGGMNLGLMPITGIPFPFLSHGGSHLMMLMLGLGLMESIKVHQ